MGLLFCLYDLAKSIQKDYKQCSFSFKVDTFNNSRSLEDQTALIESFSYIGLTGPIDLRDPDQAFVIHEFWSHERPRKLLRVYLGRFVRTRAVIFGSILTCPS